MGKVVAVLTGRAQDSIPDIAALKAAMKKSLENEDKTVTLDQIDAVVEYNVEQSFTFPAGVPVNENVAKKAAASTFSVDEMNVAIMISQARRLRGETGRRLAGIRVDAIIKTNDAVIADTMKATGADTSAVATAFATNFATAYNADPVNSGSPMNAPPTITAAAPSLAMEVTYKIVSTSATGGVVDPPAATNLKAEFTNQGGKLEIISSTMTVATPAPTSAPTMMPTPLPAGGTHAPTSMPTTSMPTPMPPTPAPPTPAPAPDTPMNTTTPAPAPKGGESAAFPTKVAGCVAI